MASEFCSWAGRNSLQFTTTAVMLPTRLLFYESITSNSRTGRPHGWLLLQVLTRYLSNEKISQLNHCESIHLLISSHLLGLWKAVEPISAFPGEESLRLDDPYHWLELEGAGLWVKTMEFWFGISQSLFPCLRTSSLTATSSTDRPVITIFGLMIVMPHRTLVALEHLKNLIWSLVQLVTCGAKVVQSGYYLHFMGGELPMVLAKLSTLNLKYSWNW